MSRVWTENEIGTEIVDAAIAVHKELGPGLLESVYEAVLDWELNRRGLMTKRQIRIPIEYKGMTFEKGFRADIIVEDLVIADIKSRESISRADRKQIQTYLKLSKRKLGYLLNFGAPLMKEGIVRAVNGL